MSQATRERKLAGWARAVKGVLASDEGEERNVMAGMDGARQGRAGDRRSRDQLPITLTPR